VSILAVVPPIGSCGDAHAQQEPDPGSRGDADAHAFEGGSQGDTYPDSKGKPYPDELLLRPIPVFLFFVHALAIPRASFVHAPIALPARAPVTVAQARSRSAAWLRAILSELSVCRPLRSATESDS
jgi:hypothetical protein